MEWEGGRGREGANGSGSGGVGVLEWEWGSGVERECWSGSRGVVLVEWEGETVVLWTQWRIWGGSRTIEKLSLSLAIILTTSLNRKHIC